MLSIVGNMAGRECIMVDIVAGTNDRIFEGGCHCGSVRFTLIGPLRKILVCHCYDCRRLTGSSWNAPRAFGGNMTIADDSTLSWYDSSPWARRGFCNKCGSHMFYQLKNETEMSVGVGMLDDSAGMEVAGQIFANSHPEWGPLDCSALENMDDELLAQYDVKPDR